MHNQTISKQFRYNLKREDQEIDSDKNPKAAAKHEASVWWPIVLIVILTLFFI